MRALFGGLIALAVAISGCTGEEQPGLRPATRPLSIVSPAFPEELSNPRPVEWESATVDGSGDHSIVVTYMGGIDSCYRLTDVSIEGDDEDIRLFLYEGKIDTDQLCPQIGIPHAVELLLSEAVGDRRIVNGALGP